MTQQQDTMRASLQQARLTTCLHLCTEMEGVKSELEAAQGNGNTNAESALPMWFRRAMEAFERPDGTLEWSAMQQAYAGQHTAILAATEVPLEDNETATAATVAKRLGIDLEEYVMDFWAEAFANIPLPQTATRAE